MISYNAVCSADSESFPDLNKYDVTYNGLIIDILMMETTEEGKAN